MLTSFCYEGTRTCATCRTALWHLDALPYAIREVKDMGQQMGYRSLEWNWPKESMNIPNYLLGQELLMESSCFNFLVDNFPLLLFQGFEGLVLGGGLRFFLVPVFDCGRYGIYF